ncbi:MAG TPA: error-prone DNA polymerase [Geminicoccaceae bacterium]|nr:error-prone DNA polymerase [Geminicoccus sp.]HMU52302.1 error-prone DNA polymerase [Geminicoccaceae bacterium]
MTYAELQVTTHFSFLRGASSCEELFVQAAALGLPALGITDRHSLAGMVRAHQAAETTGVRLVVGCRLDLTDGLPVLVYPTDRPAYARLCRLLTVGKRRAGKGACELGWADLVEHGEGMLAVLVPDAPDETLAARLDRLRGEFGDRAYLALTLRRRPNDALRLHGLAQMAAAARVPTVATNDVLYHHPERRILQDVVTCIRHTCTIDELGFRRERFADRHLKPPEEMARLFARHPEAVERTVEIAGRCRFSLKDISYQYPHEALTPGETAQQTLERLTWKGAAQCYPDVVPEKVTAQLHRELNLISKLEYAPFFLTVDAIVRFARSQNILCQGRGSAANSAVCFVLGITSIDPAKNDLLFERFVSAERKEPPDIDVDFEHDRREEVIQHVYETYGRDRAALCATVIRYRSRAALRDVGKAMGLGEDVIAALASQIWGWSNSGLPAERVRELGLDPSDHRLKLTLALAYQLIGTPRHLSQHPGGFVLTQDRLDELVPIEPAAMKERQVIEWDKDDIDALRFMKVDVLGLGMLGCLRRSFELLHFYKGIDHNLVSVPQDDKPTYEMISKADTIGVFQIESRAQMSMLPRLRPKELYDLVIEVAIVRPGPIQGDMVHPYLRRRHNLEPVSYPKPELEEVLHRTKGVPLFQEQAMLIAIKCAGFKPGEADQLRRSMATFKDTGTISHHRKRLIEGMTANGYEQDLAERIFKQLEGFASYGFPESHAASFAQLAYVSSWLKCHHPEVFCTALLNSQPMGFYHPPQIVRDAREHGVEVRPVDVARSDWDCTLEPAGEGLAVRLGLRMVKGLSEKNAKALRDARATAPFAGIEDLWSRAALPAEILEKLAMADAFAGPFGLSRREALWAVKALRDQPLPLAPPAAEPATPLAPMTAGREVFEDYEMVGLTLRRHPVAFLRGELDRSGTLRCAALRDVADGRIVTVAGKVLVRQHPGSSKGVVFVTLEDETGIANLVVWPDMFERHRRLVMSAEMIACHGRVQNESGVIHVVADRLHDLTRLYRTVPLRDDGRQLALPYAGSHQTRRRLRFRSRDFH